MLIIVIISILGIAGLAAIGKRFLPVTICPPCAGVAGTWLWMLGARATGYAIDPILLALLVGGSIVGISYQLAKRLPNPSASPLFRTLFTAAGLIAGYGIIIQRWEHFAIGTGLLIVNLAGFFHRASTESNATTTRLEKELDNCCS